MTAVRRGSWTSREEGVCPLLAAGRGPFAAGARPRGRPHPQGSDAPPFHSLTESGCSAAGRGPPAPAARGGGNRPSGMS